MAGQEVSGFAARLDDAARLRDRGELGHALDRCDAVLADPLVGQAERPDTRALLVSASLLRAEVLLELGRARDGLEELDRSLSALDPDRAEDAGAIARGLRLCARTLAGEGRSTDAMAALSELDELLADDPEARAEVVRGQAERADLLAAAGRRDDALDLLVATIARFTGDPDEVVVTAVAGLVAQDAALRTAAGDGRA